MKSNTMKSLSWKLCLLPVLALFGCQRVQQAPITPAAQAVDSLTNRISSSFKARQAVTAPRGVVRAAVGDFGDLFGGTIGSTGWGPQGPWSGTPYQNTYFHASDVPVGPGGPLGIEQDIRQCIALVRAIPPSADNFQFMVSTLSRCLNIVVTYRNPMYSYGYQNQLDPLAQEEMRYLYDGYTPGYFGQFGGMYNAQQPFANQTFNQNNINWLSGGH